MHSKQRARRARVAWFNAMAAFGLMVYIGIYATDVIRTSDGERPPTVAVVCFVLLVGWLLKRYFHGYFQRKG
ncbi:MAG: hypothetical protein GAK28_03807 [Luteibacter sp.]|uniref:hypothetical protein n=1 Tax=Luteibacter sp. TaxID=1886636 RepID=UPI0013841AC5|nr:hypothetical protein [Luteibacter sp.]KAF1004794.1 MAG: hypothetical protein GAK28_03807 [Luteibacter sp.]